MLDPSEARVHLKPEFVAKSGHCCFQGFLRVVAVSIGLHHRLDSLHAVTYFGRMRCGDPALPRVTASTELPEKDSAMASAEKRRISAQQILSDIRAGMEAEQLKVKYSLSDRSLESVFRKLATAGLLSEAEMQRRSLSLPPLRDAPQKDTQTATVKTCPACQAPLPSDSEECSVCGVVPAKFSARREQGSSAALAAQEGESPSGSRWPLICCILAAVVVGGGYYLFSLKDKAQEKPGTVAGSGRPEVSETARKQPKAPARASAEKRRKQKEAPTVPNIFAMNTGELLELQFVPEGFPLGLSVSQGSGGVHFFEQPDANQGFKKFPAETEAKRYYDQLTIAGQTFLMITEGSNPPKIYLDANRNGDMTDDPGPFVGEGPHAAPNHYTLELPYQGEETTVPYRLWLFPSNMGGIRFSPQCYWLGEIEINGNTYKVFTFDGNADGDYSNDPLIIDVDDDGKASDSERIKPGQSLTIDGIEVRLLANPPSVRWVRVQY